MLVWFGTAMAQEKAPVAGGTQQPGRDGGQGGRGGNWDPQQMQQRWLDHIKESLQTNDQEWQVLKPRIEKVMTLSRQTMGMRMMGRRDNNAGSTEQMSPVEKATGELRTILEKKDATSKEIGAKLTALREAKKSARKNLTDAQSELTSVLTPKQEAQLVLWGMLD